MTIPDVLLGRRLASAEDKEERVSAVSGVAIFGLDGLGSAAYGPEAALTVLIPLGLAGLGFSLPILGLIVALLAIVYFSYRQTIAAYPTGAGSYTVAKENLGEHAGLLAAVALMIDYAPMTGVEAVSNGIQAFREPVVDTARRCLTLIVAILAFLPLGVAFVLPFYHIVATDPGKPGYQSLLSLVTEAIWGRGFLYYLTIASILAVLSLSANTSFADFPRLCQRLAHDGFLPYAFGLRGRRLVFTHRICVLAVVAAALLIFFNGVTDRLIPLFAVGAFGTFTLSQAGMVRHGFGGEKRSSVSAFINGLGAFATGAALLIIVVAKFTEGAWLVVIVLPCLYAVMLGIKKHSARIAR